MRRLLLFLFEGGEKIKTDFEMRVEIPIELYNHFAKQAEARHCTIEVIVIETIKRFLAKEDLYCPMN